MGLRGVHHVVHPARTLLHAQIAPLRLGHQVRLGNMFGQVLGKYYVPARGDSSLKINKHCAVVEMHVPLTGIQSYRRSTSPSTGFDRPALQKHRKPEVNKVFNLI